MNTENIIRSKSYELIGNLIGIDSTKLKNIFNKRKLDIRNSKDIKEYINYLELSKPWIYKIQCKMNWKVYIGSTLNLHRRLKQHKDELFQGKHWIKLLQKDFDLYWIEWFDFDILEKLDFTDEKPRHDREYEIINTYPVEMIYNTLLTENWFIVNWVHRGYILKCMKYKTHIDKLIKELEN